MTSPVEKKKKISYEDNSSLIGENQQQKTLGSFVPSSFGTKKKCRLRKIWICTDVWMDILPFFDRAQLCLKLALLSPRFDCLVDTHFDGKSDLTLWHPIAIRKDHCAGKAMLFAHIDANSEQFPLPDRPLPNKIRFFKHLHIQYIDHSVIAFLRANKHIWNRGTKLDLNVNSPKIWDVLAQHIWPIFVPNIRHLLLPNGAYLDNLCRLISPTFLTDLNQLNSIDSCDLFPDGIISAAAAVDGPNATSAGQALSKWLHNPRKDGQPKQLCCSSYNESEAKEWVNNFKQSFLRAVTSATYNIELCTASTATIEQFELVNERTQEKLTLSKEREKAWESRWVMKRCPISGETAAVQWEDENLDELSTVYFDLYDGNANNYLGPLSETDKSNEKVFSSAAGPSSDQQKE